ncbi:hypothetical protein O3P69_012805 [Scylla paramamosain]|uniref:Uncharacterized protein n=1 Tax=Scylla paramamosain TaxID=85552 RepID=A0AAW0TT51_SCYPA
MSPQPVSEAGREHKSFTSADRTRSTWVAPGAGGQVISTGPQLTSPLTQLVALLLVLLVVMVVPFAFPLSRFPRPQERSLGAHGRRSLLKVEWCQTFVRKVT